MLDELRSAARESVARALWDVPRLLRHPVWRNADPGQGNGLGVVLVPGFGAGDASLRPAASWLQPHQVERLELPRDPPVAGSCPR